MNSQALGELASDQKIQNVFYAFGYSIPVGKDGRRLWTRKFKDEMGRPEAFKIAALYIGREANILRRCCRRKTLVRGYMRRLRMNAFL